jgi:hypothetical protein
MTNYEKAIREKYSWIRDQYKEEFEFRLKTSLPWLEAPSRWKASKEHVELALNPEFYGSRQFLNRLRARQRDVVAHRLIVKHGWRFEARSDSGTIYLLSPAGSYARISDHQLGFADYGTREQYHRGGPDIVLDEIFDSPDKAVAYALDEERQYRES